MSESKTQCPLCHNFENHQACCRIGTLELELNEAREEIIKLEQSQCSTWFVEKLRAQLTTAQQELAQLRKELSQWKP